jgi:rfaE bifunctional protein nucleotidyltransferase chain/domain
MRTRGRLLRFESKIKTLGSLAKIIRGLKKKGRRIVFTNGCFDILHFGHIKYLQDAKAKGDILVVGLNSDSSVRRLKGTDRPIVEQKHRAAVLAALGSVDFVVIFSEDTPELVIRTLLPDVLVKGGDWKIQDIIGSEVVMRNGGKVFSIKFVKGLSTTSLIKKIAHGL